MTHYSREQLERVMKAYCFMGHQTHYSSVELYAVPVIDNNLETMTGDQRKEITCRIIEDLRAIDFLIPDTTYRQYYSINHQWVWPK